MHQFRVGNKVTVPFFGTRFGGFYHHEVLDNSEGLLEHQGTDTRSSRGGVVIDIARVEAEMRFRRAYAKVRGVDTNVLVTSQVSSDCGNAYYACSKLVAGSGRGLDLDLSMNLFREVECLRVELEPFELGFYEVCHLES